MAEHDKHDQPLEEMLDSMLSNYSDEQPRPGLETRVLATLRAEASQKPEHAPFWRWLWSSAATLALVAIALAVYIGRLQPPPAPPAVGAMKPPPEAAPGVPRIHRRPRTAGDRESEKPERSLAMAARQEVFPAPVPLTDQERLLLRYLANTAAEEVVAQSHSDGPAPEDGRPLPPQVQEFKITEAVSTR
ncbi:MAG TPA: hypothetical protein VNW97_13255 [Candidatus Saccharimonadales bacterium]|jgi:hypothetical protein|nr:hypothetical protein [Candidatus Saccharimonadales bacterium]